MLYRYTRKRSFTHIRIVFIEACRRHHISRRLLSTTNLKYIFVQAGMQIKLIFVITLSFHFICLNTKRVIIIPEYTGESKYMYTRV